MRRYFGCRANERPRELPAVLMLRALFLSLLLLFATAPADAQHNIFLATGHVPPVPIPPSNCPFVIDNGCSSSQPLQAGSGALLLANARATPATNMINLLNATPTDFSANGPQRNQAGIDYPVGEFMPLASLTQVNSSTMAAIGCSFNATGTSGIGGPLATCTPGVGATINLADFDFTNGGTTCIALKVNGNNGTMNISDAYWFNNGKCAGDANQATMLWVTGRTTAPTNVSFVTLDANKANFPYSFGSCPRASGLTAALPCNPSNAYIAEGAFEIDHSAFIGFTTRPLDYFAADISVGTLASFNVLVGCCSLSSAAHNEYSEYVLGNSGGAGQTWIGNTFITTTFHQNNGFAPLPILLPSGTGGPVPIFDVENNFYADAVAGGGTTNTKETWAGNITGGTFTTSSVTGGVLGSGQQTTCGGVISVGGVGGFEVAFLPIYAGLTGTTSAGPGGGGHSTVSNGAQFQMSWSQTVVTAGIDDGTGNNPTYTATFNQATGALTITSAVTGGTVANGQIISGAGITGQPTITSGSGTSWTTSLGGGSSTLTGITIKSGTPGNVINVSIDNALTLIVGDKISFLSGAGTRTITVGGPGSTGTYTADASGYSPQTQLNATPNDPWPGGWSVPGTLACASQVPQYLVSWSNVFMSNQGSMGQVTAVGNYMDLWPFGSAVLGTTTIANNTTSQIFNGTIVGGVLTVNSGTTPAVGRLITTVSGAAPNTIIGSSLGGGQFNVTPSQNVGPASMLATDVFCTIGLTIFGSPGNNPNVDMSLINSEPIMDSYGASVVHGNGCAL